MSLFFTERPEKDSISAVSLTLLAHLGDAVFHLFEREREIFAVKSAKELHSQVNRRVNAEKQAELLDFLTASLNDEERDLVRRARNIKASNYKRAVQSVSRKATAFEALLGYLYLKDQARLRFILSLTVTLI